MVYRPTQTTNIRRAKISTVMRCKAFREGFDEARRGLPLRDYPIRGKQWSYERGRLFGITYRGPFKKGNSILPEAYVAFEQALEDHTII